MKVISTLTFTFASAARIIGCSETGIRQLVSVHKDKLKPALYRRQPSDPGLRLRYLLASDLVVLRNILFSGERFQAEQREEGEGDAMPLSSMAMFELLTEEKKRTRRAKEKREGLGGLDEEKLDDLHSEVQATGSGAPSVEGL